MWKRGEHISLSSETRERSEHMSLTSSTWTHTTCTLSLNLYSLAQPVLNLDSFNLYSLAQPALALALFLSHQPSPAEHIAAFLFTQLVHTVL